MRRPLFLFLLLAIGIPSAQHAVFAEKKTLDVRDVRFEGNSVYSGGDLLKLMVCRPSGLFHSTEFRQQVFEDDLQNIVNYYHDNGYLQARILDSRVTVDSADEAVDLYIRMTEGVVTKIDSIRVDGNRAFSDTTLLYRVDLKSGQHLYTQKIHDGMLSMATLYADSGYLSATVTPEAQVDSNVHLASLSFHVKEGTRYSIESIAIRGLQHTNEHVVQRELLFRDGDVVNYADLLETQRRLYLTGLFESVFVRPDSAEDPTKKVIVVELREKLAGEFNLGLSYGSVEKIRGKMQVQTANLAGTGRQLGSTILLSFIQQRAEGSFSEPWTFGTRWRTDINAYFELQQQPGYDIRRYGGTATLGHLLGRRSNVSLTYRLENGRLSNVKVVDTLVQNFDPKVRSLTLTYKLDDRDDPFNTTSGTYTELNNELAGAFLQGNNTFVRTTARFKYFYSFDDATVLGTALQVGWMHAFGSTSTIPLSERFFAGGPNALRSFDYQRIGPLDPSNNPLGGTVEFIWNLAELRRAVYKFFGAVAFVDIGQVWGKPRDVRLNDIRISIGPGLRLNTPLGMARLDYGFNFFSRSGEASGKIFFSMGQAF
jgi:outer membrane protein insertion porin family